MVDRQVAKDTCLNLHLLSVGFPLYLVASLQLLARHNIERLKHLDGFLVKVTVEDNWTRGFNVESATCSLFLPFITIAIAVEAYILTGLDIVTQSSDNSRCGILTLSDAGINTLLKTYQSLSNRRVEGYHSRSTISLTAWSTELKAVAREGKW